LCGVAAMKRLKAKRKIPTSVELDPYLVAAIKEAAEACGVPYQVLLRMFIIEGFKSWQMTPRFLKALQAMGLSGPSKSMKGKRRLGRSTSKSIGAKVLLPHEVGNEFCSKFFAGEVIFQPVVECFHFNASFASLMSRSRVSFSAAATTIMTCWYLG
jgi:hypothetical protein